MHVLTSRNRFGVHLTGGRVARNGITALMHAAVKGHEHVVELLVAGADLAAKDNDG
jgi:ankyrin repeat protein